MGVFAKLLVLSLVGLLAAAPVKESDANETIFVTNEYYSPAFVKYTGQHDIVNLIVSVDSLWMVEQRSRLNVSTVEIGVTLFFVEADTTPEGKRIDQGLYVLQDGKANKLLDNGRDAAAASDDSEIVYFGASDGIYVYKNGSTEKYGSLNDSIIGIAKQLSGAGLYILTEDHEVYNVTDGGNKKTKIDSIVNAKQIVLDVADNIYFYSDDNQVQVLTSEGVKKITGLPENPSSLTLIKPPIVFEEGLPVVVNNYTCMLYPNGTSIRGIIEFKPNTKPTAYGSEGTLVQYYAHDKKIYEYNLISLLMNSDLDDLKRFLDDNTDTIQSLAANSTIAT